MNNLFMKNIFNHFFIIAFFSIYNKILGNASYYFFIWILLFSIAMFLSALPMFFINYNLIISKASDFDNILLNLSSTINSLSIKNYRIMLEYKTVYSIHYKNIKNTIKNQIKNQNSEIVSYVLDNDESNKMVHFTEIIKIIDKINLFIRICYCLSFINPDDTMTYKDSTILLNIESQSLSNKRNRQIEELLNLIDDAYKIDLHKSWTKINPSCCDHLSLIPIKWIIGEYRTLYQYLYVTKHFNDIYNKFNYDFYLIDSHVNDLCVIFTKLNKLTKMNKLNKLTKSTKSTKSNDIFIIPSEIIGLLISSSIYLSDYIFAIIIGSCNNLKELCFIIFSGLFVILFIMYIINLLSDFSSKIIQLSKFSLDETDFLSFDSRIQEIFNNMDLICFI